MNINHMMFVSPGFSYSKIPHLHCHSGVLMERYTGFLGIFAIIKKSLDNIFNHMVFGNYWIFIKVDDIHIMFSEQGGDAGSHMLTCRTGNTV